jgi:hypothetical protein
MKKKKVFSKAGVLGQFSRRIRIQEDKLGPREFVKFKIYCEFAFFVHKRSGSYSGPAFTKSLIRIRIQQIGIRNATQQAYLNC